MFTISASCKFLLAATLLATVIRPYKSYYHQLKAGGYFACVREGKVILYENDGQGQPHESIRKYIGVPWTASAPHIFTMQGSDQAKQYLTYDAVGKTTEVWMQDRRGPWSEWAFEITENIEPKSKDLGHKSGGTVTEGHKGVKFRLQATEGPYKGWFVATEEIPRPRLEPDPPDDRPRKIPPPILRRMFLVPDKKDAAELTFLEYYRGYRF